MEESPALEADEYWNQGVHIVQRHWGFLVNPQAPRRKILIGATGHLQTKGPPLQLLAP
jgi:hypothetical protein